MALHPRALGAQVRFRAIQECHARVHTSSITFVIRTGCERYCERDGSRREGTQISRERRSARAPPGPYERRRWSASYCEDPMSKLGRALEICVPYWFSGRPAAARRQMAALLQDGRPHGRRSDGIMLGGGRGIAGERASSSPLRVLSLLTEPPRCSPCALQATPQLRTTVCRRREQLSARARRQRGTTRLWWPGDRTNRRRGRAG